MFGELPKLFDKNFMIANILPVSIFLLISALILKLFGYWPIVGSVLTGEILYDASLAILVTWILGILLLVLNRDIYRLLEGYGKYNPLKIFEKHAKATYRNKVERLNQLADEYLKTGTNFPADMQKEREILMIELARKYPDNEDFVLPTEFGNALRAFEIYPRVMYGLEGIDGWPRILAVLPKEFLDLINDAKSQVDWWVNLSVLSFGVIFEFWVLVFCKWGLALPWIYVLLDILIPIIVLVVLNRLLIWRSVSSVIGWGNLVKSAFDIYRFDLIELLGIDSYPNRDNEKTMWKSFSQAIIYRRPDVLPRLRKYKNKKREK